MNNGIVDDVTDRVDLRDAKILGGFGGPHRITDQFLQVTFLRLPGTDEVYRVETVETLRETTHGTYRVGNTVAARKNWKECAALYSMFYQLSTLPYC